MLSHLRTRQASRAARLTLVAAALAMLLVVLGARQGHGPLVLAGGVLALAMGIGVLAYAWRRVLHGPPLLGQSEAEVELALGGPRVRLMMGDGSYWLYGPGAGSRPVPGDTILHFRTGRLVGYVVRWGEGTPVGDLTAEVLSSGAVPGA